MVSKAPEATEYRACGALKIEQYFLVWFFDWILYVDQWCWRKCRGKGELRDKEVTIIVSNHRHHHHNRLMDPTHAAACAAAENHIENHKIVGTVATDLTNNADIPSARQMTASAMAPHFLPLSVESHCPKVPVLDHPSAHLSRQSRRTATEQQNVAASTGDTGLAHVDNEPCPIESALCCIVARCDGLPDPPSLPGAIKRAFDSALARASLAATKDDALCHACAVIEALARAYQYIPDEILADASLESVSIWLLGAAGKHACARVCSDDAVTILQIHEIAVTTGTDSVDNVTTSACAAGDESNAVVPLPPKCRQAPACARLEHMDAVIKNFAIDLLRADASPLCIDSMHLCRGPVRLLARALRDAVASAHALQSPVPGLSGIAHAQSAIAQHMGDAVPREAVAYTLGLLLSIDASRVDIRDQSGYPTLQEAAPILANPSHPLHSVLVESLDITGINTEDTADNNDSADRGDCVAPADGATYSQVDLVMCVYDHEPDLFMAIMSHADPGSIGALALTSRSHYALIARTLRDDDARGDARQLKRVALSGIVWLQDYSGSAMYRPCAHAITPTSLGQGPLPGLRSILSACALMARIEKSEERTGLWFSMHKLATACALGCGGAVARYLSAIKCDLDPDTTGKRRLADCHTRIARCAGMYASPTMMRIAITAMSRLIAEYRSSRSRFRTTDQITQIQLLVINAVSGIVRGFALSSTRRRSLPDLSALVDVLCAFLAAVRRDMDGHGWAGKYIFAKLRATFCRAALVALAPGTSLPMPSARIRLASALFEAARPEPSW
nr:dihydrofolate reductase motif-containing protein [Pandoravirus massiliensis]